MRLPITVFLLILFGMVLHIDIARAQSRTVQVTLALICDIYEMTEQNGRGGYARIAKAIRNERERNPNVVVAHAGDAISPSLMSSFDNGKHVMDLTNLIGIDLFVPGNHEFDFGPEIFRQRMSEARMPLLAANLRDENGQPIPGFADTKMVEFDGVQIGIIGLTAENSVDRSSPGNLKFESSISTARKLAPQLRSEGADIVVLVAHAPRRQDFRLVGVEGVDVLLSGDDHDLVVFYNGSTAFVEAKQDGEYITAVDLEISISGEGEDRRVKWWPGFRVVDTGDVDPDKAVAARVAEYQAELSRELDVEIGEVTTAMDSRKATVRTRESAIGNLVSDALRKTLNADVAVYNGGGIRGNRTYEPGSRLTRRNIRTELPFGNKAVLLEVTGEQLLKVLENGLWFAGKPNGRFLHVSGVVIEADPNKVPGEKILSATIGGKKIDPGAQYKLATNSFLASGREGFDVLKEAKIILGENDGDIAANVVSAYVAENAPVSPAVEGRIVFK